MTKKNQEIRTPWGTSEDFTQIAPGIMSCATASHGGFYLNEEMNRRIPRSMKEATMNQDGLDGWYEEDADWAIVVYCLKEHFDKYEYQAAVHVLKAFYPELRKDISRGA